MSLNIKNKIVLITGASSGIGKAAAYDFAKQGCRLILMARRNDRLAVLADTLKTEFSVDVLNLQVDVQSKQAVRDAFQQLPKDWQRIEILINNAGLASTSLKLQEADSDAWDVMIDTNIKGLLYVTQEVLKTMIQHNSGHIINVSSIAGSDYYPGGNIYAATKYAVRSISNSLRIDLLGYDIRITDIAPGAVHTEFSEVRWQDKAKSDQFYADFRALKPEDISDAMVYCATRPHHVDVAEMKIFPIDQASCNHLHKKGEKVKNLFGE